MTKVRDIENTVKVLKRMENYAWKYMDEVKIEQAESKLSIARETMKNMLDEFMDMDVEELRPAFNGERRRIRALEEDIAFLKDEIKDVENAVEKWNNSDDDDREWLESPDDLEEALRRINEAIWEKTEEIDKLKEIIS